MSAVGTATQAHWTQRCHRASTLSDMWDTNQRFPLFKAQES